VVDGLQIQAERDSNNNARELEAPPWCQRISSRCVLVCSLAK
jgi:hypothetical protein